MKDVSIKKIKAVVALSGGVDSAVAATLLKKQGFHVVGAYFRLGNFSLPSERQAEKVAKKIGIPLKIADARKEFRKRVINYFLNSYKIGLTPNPCVVCNKEIKFALLFDLMKKDRADFVATGHYARILHKTHNTKHITQKKELRVTSCELQAAKDKTKDQSYFLYRLAQKDLAKIIFPLGNYKKSEVKRIAKNLKLPISASEESQDVCFAARNGTAEFLKQNIKAKSGNIVDFPGNILGRHKGLPLYTLGQRKGIEIGGTGPYWVAGKDIGKNELVVTKNPQKILAKKFLIHDTSWINRNIKFPLRAKVQIRYHAPKVDAIIKPVARAAFSVELKKPMRAVTPGQSAVVYKNDEVLGGGIII